MPLHGGETLNISLPAGTLIPVTDANVNWNTINGVNSGTVVQAAITGTLINITDAPAAGQRIVLTDILVSISAAARVDIREETSGNIIASFQLGQNVPFQWKPRGKVKTFLAGKRVQAIVYTAGTISILAQYYYEV